MLLFSLVACTESEETLIRTPLPTQSEKTDRVKVLRVIDGDTIEVIFSDNTIDTVRMLGVDTPETRSKNKPYEYEEILDLYCLKEWGKKANQYSENILEGKNINLIYDEKSGRRGYYDRVLAYIEINDYDFTESLVSKGYARVYDESDFSRKHLYITKQKEAIGNKSGLWSECQ